MNKVVLVGRVVKAPFVTINKNGFKIAKFRVVVARNFEYKNQTSDFIPCVAFKARAEFADKYLDKGDLVSIEGKFCSSSYMNKDNQLINEYYVIVDSLIGLEPKYIKEIRRNNNGNNSNQNPYLSQNNLDFEENEEELETIPWDEDEEEVKEVEEKVLQEENILTVPKENLEEEEDETE